MPRGANPGNLNAATPRGRALAFWNRRALSPKDQWVKGLVTEYTSRRVADLGGEGVVTQGQRSLIQTAAICHAVVALIFAASKDKGGLLIDGEDGLSLTGAARELPKFLARVQAAEVALGVEPVEAKSEADAYALMNAKAVPVEAKRIQ